MAGRVLIIGATGFIGKFIAEASLASPHPTYLLLRPGPLLPSKDPIIKAFQLKGAILIQGEMNNKNSMEKILKDYEIDIVISAIGPESLLDQLILVEAMKSRFLASEFGHDVERADPVEPGLTMYKEKRMVRRVVKESGVPYTNICCNSIASWPYYDNCHPSHLPPPLDYLHIYAHGNVKAYFVDGNDIGKFTMKVIDDDRTVNKTVHFRPSSNCFSINELASLWENKIGRTIPRVIISEDHLLAVAAENRIPQSIVASFTHDIFIKGCQVNFDIDGPDDVEISTLYPDEAFRSLEDCFEDFALMVDDKIQRGKLKLPAQKSVVEEAVPMTASCGEETPQKCSKI
ncbi:hypothetical protein Fmac_023930 [Flemingia macrophylla]|uniref:NmrA-like domain-containing protein n=1 Tax=Flemingia macrophylla TaxID=520843 RepID=A0ABD1LMY4_9FABA